MKTERFLKYIVGGAILLLSPMILSAQTAKIYKGSKADGSGKLIYEIIDADSIVFLKNSDADDESLKISLNTNDDYNDLGVTVTGTPGEVGAVYSIPLKVRGKYGMKFDFKMPKTLNNVSSVWQLASFGTRNAKKTNGFLINIGGELTTPQSPYAQPQFNSWIGAYVTESTTNNYAVTHKPCESKIIGQFSGEAAFSVRYKGSDTDVCLQISANVFRIYHSSNNVDIVNIRLTNGMSLTSLTTALAGFNSIVEVNCYNIEGKTTDDLVWVNNIPLIASYNGTDYEAFPSYIMLYDDKWHTAEIYFDANYSSGYDMLRIYIDGYHLRQLDSSFSLEGNGFFDSVLTLGGSDIMVKDFKFSENFRSDIPNIFCVMNHEIADRTEVDYSLPQSDLSISYNRTKDIIDMADECGLTYVTSSQIRDYFKDGTPLPHNCWTIIHDDYYYLSEHYARYNATCASIKDLYIANSMKVSFGIIALNNQLTQSVAMDIRRDKNLFEFLIHDAYSLVSKQGYSAIKTRIEDNIEAFKNILWNCDIWVYSGGQNDVNTRMMLKYEGNINLAWWNEMFPSRGSVSNFSNLMSLPRAGMHDSGASLSFLKDKIEFVKRHY